MSPKKAPSKYSRVSKRKSNNTIWLAIAIAAILIISVGAYLALANQTPTSIAPTKVLLQTSAGNITIDLRTDKPITSTNFINLVKDGKYDGSTFHRTVENFMIQGGKISGSTPTIRDEIGNNNRNINCTIAMAKTSAPNSATSEFFINVDDNGMKYSSSNFDGTYTVFGTVISGQDVVKVISIAPATANPAMNGEVSLPVNPVTIISATIVP
jgi:cyclophilin family peptidyl-prolyl cis-trans isomerase